MPPIVERLRKQLMGPLRGMSARGRAITAIVLLGAIGGLGYLSFGDSVAYVPLFTGLSETDAAGITAELRKNKTPFQLGAGGVVLVPADDVHQLRLDMAGKGLPRGGGVGFEIFDDQKFGLSDFAQQVNYRRALQGELERTIAQLQAVEAARVHIALPERQTFMRHTRPASASVTLRLHPARSLPRAAVKGIVHLVSSSVAGLSPGAITVVDGSGTMLWGGSEDGILGSAGGLLEYRDRLESSLEERVQQIADRALGYGQAVIKVSAQLALGQTEQTDEQYDPNQVVVRSESQSEEQGAASQQPGGVVGARSNLPGGTTSTTSESAGGTRKQVTRNFEVAKTVRRSISPAGALSRLSVAVLVNSAALKQLSAASAKGGASGSKAAAFDEVEALEALANVVKQAVGFSAARGDEVTVRAMPFAARPEQTDGPAPVGVRWLVQKAPTWAWVGAALAVLVVVVLLLVVLLRRRQPRAVDLLDTPRTLRELDQSEALRNAQKLQQGANTQALPQGTSLQLAEAAAQHDALRAAQVLRAWMAGG